MLGIFGIFALAASALVTINAIASRAVAQSRDVGLLKTLGFTDGNVLGMMPHPERASESVLAAEGAKNEAITIFRSLVSNLKPKAIA